MITTASAAASHFMGPTAYQTLRRARSLEANAGAARWAVARHSSRTCRSAHAPARGSPGGRSRGLPSRHAHHRAAASELVAEARTYVTRLHGVKMQVVDRGRLSAQL